MLGTDQGKLPETRRPDPVRNPYLQHLVDIECGMTGGGAPSSLRQGMERIEGQKREALGTYLRLAAMRLGILPSTSKKTEHGSDPSSEC